MARGPGRPDGPTGVRAERRTISAGGRDRTFTVVSTADVRRPRAVLVLVLHGSHQTGAKVRAMSGGTFDRLVGDRAAVVVYPDAVEGLWSDARSAVTSPARTARVDDVEFLGAVLEGLLEEHGPLPVCVVGYSNGGQMAIRLVHERPEWLRGAVLVGATQPTPDVFAVDRDRQLPLPVVLIHGTRDRLVPYGGGMATLFGFRPRGTGLSAPDTARYYAARNQIDAEPTLEDLPRRAGSGKTSVTAHRWLQTGHPGVTLYTVTGGGHTIPNPTHRAPRLLGRTTRDVDAGAVVGQLLDDARPASRPS